MYFLYDKSSKVFTEIMEYSIDRDRKINRKFIRTPINVLILVLQIKVYKCLEFLTKKFFHSSFLFCEHVFVTLHHFPRTCLVFFFTPRNYLKLHVASIFTRKLSYTLLQYLFATYAVLLYCVLIQRIDMQFISDSALFT